MDGGITVVMKGNIIGYEWRFGDDWPGLRCGALTRTGRPCRKAALRGKSRCRNHGGASTGPKTEVGRARIAKTKTIHGRLTKGKRAEAKRRAEVGREIRAELSKITAWALDNGFARSSL